jgi:hypothetical protein
VAESRAGAPSLLLEQADRETHPSSPKAAMLANTE